MTKVSAKAVSMFMALAMLLGIAGVISTALPAYAADRVVTYVVDGSVWTTRTVSNDPGVTIPDPGEPPRPANLPDNYHFDGWYSDDKYENRVWVGTYGDSVTSDMKLYGRFLATWTIEWDLGGASFPTQDLKFEDGWSTEIATAEEVAAWGIEPPANTKYDGVTIDGVHYAPGSTFVLKKNVVVKVEWKSTLPNPSPTNSSSPTAAPGDNSGSNAAGGAAGSNVASKPVSGGLAATGADVSVASALALLLAGSLLLVYRRKTA